MIYMAKKITQKTEKTIPWSVRVPIEFREWGEKRMREKGLDKALCTTAAIYFIVSMPEKARERLLDLYHVFSMAGCKTAETGLTPLEEGCCNDDTIKILDEFLSLITGTSSRAALESLKKAQRKAAIKADTDAVVRRTDEKVKALRSNRDAARKASKKVR